MNIFHREKLQDKGHGYQFAPAGAVADQTLLAVATAYKTGVSRKYKTLPARLIPQTFAQSKQVAVSKKYDGEGVFLYFEAGEACLINAPSGRCRLGLPCIQEAAEALKKAGVSKALMAAELHLQGPVRTRHSDVAHISANGSPEERTALALALYDVIMVDGKDRRNDQQAFGENWNLLGEIFGEADNKKTCHRAEGKIIPGTEVEGFFHEVVNHQGEGIVARFPDAQGIYKIKPSITVDAVVIGMVEGDFEGQYGVLSLLTGLCAPDGKTIQTLARVGSGFTDELRKRLLEELQALKTNNPITMTDSEGRPIQFVAPKLVVEIEGEALQEESLDGKPCASQTFRWEKATMSFVSINKRPRLTHPTLARVREDKIWDDGGTRTEQILSEAQSKALCSSAPPKENQPARISREVYTKEGKNGLAVRKILVIERTDPTFHKWTILWVDFSPGRAKPLKTEVAVADSPQRTEALVKAYREEAGKKGWNQVGTQKKD
jgi:hypothetical protein